MQQLTKFVKTSSIIALSFIMLTFAGCSKGGDSGSTTPPTPPTPPVVIVPPTPPPTPDAAIAFDIKIDGVVVNNNNGVFPVVGTSVTINAFMTSKLPTAGVIIELSVKNKLDDKIVVFTSKLPTSQSESNPIIVTGLKRGEYCVANITVTSASDNKNFKFQSLDLAAK
jgi:hypothetical protein